jgi:hypothetical protein
MTTLVNILNWWSTNRVPTVLQRQLTFQSFRHKADAVPLSEVDGLVAALNAKADKLSAQVVILPAGTTFYDVEPGTLIRSIWFQLTTAASIGVGYSSEDNDVYEMGEASSNGDIVFDGIKVFRTATRIYFNNYL